MKSNSIFRLSLSLLVMLMISTVSVASAIDIDDEEITIDEEQIIAEYMERESALSLDEYIEAARYAYLDAEAYPEMQERIISARNTIIFAESWTVEPGQAWIETASGEIRELPDFYSIFPADWDIPVNSEEAIAQSTNSYADIAESKFTTKGRDDIITYHIIQG